MKYELRRIMDSKEANLIIRRYLEKYIDFNKINFKANFRNETIYYKVYVDKEKNGLTEVFASTIAKGKYLELLRRALESEGYVVSRLYPKIKERKVYYELYYGLIIEEGRQRIRRK